MRALSSGMSRQQRYHNCPQDCHGYHACVHYDHSKYQRSDYYTSHREFHVHCCHAKILETTNQALGLSLDSSCALRYMNPSDNY